MAPPGGADHRLSNDGLSLNRPRQREPGSPTVRMAAGSLPTATAWAYASVTAPGGYTHPLAGGAHGVAAQRCGQVGVGGVLGCSGEDSSDTGQ